MNITLWWTWCGAILITAYLVGSLPTGYIAGRLIKGIDIREHGSGSTGATNVLRTLGKGPGFLVLMIDTLKGVGAIALVNWLFITAPFGVSDGGLAWMVAIGGLAALLGHSKSIWLGFTGGKSVATSLGVLLAMSWQVGLATLGVFGLVLTLTRIVSLSSVTGAVAVSVFMILLHQPLPYELFAIAGGLYVLWRHRSNMQRLLAGTEPQLGQKLVAPEQNLE